IYSIAPSYIDINRIWIGTDDGVIRTTMDGGATWKDVTPPALKPWMKVFNMDAGRFDARTAYAAVNTLRLDDMRPHLWRTHDGGHWPSLQLNMAPSSVRDLIVKDDDLVAATHGRGFWILDDLTPLRQIDHRTVAANVVLFKPQTAYRVRWNTNTDTPLPPDEPAAPNPPEGAIIDYYLKTSPPAPIT